MIDRNVSGYWKKQQRYNLWGLICVIITTLLVATVVFQLWKHDWRTPLFYSGGGDDTTPFVFAKSMQEFGRYASNPNLGAPFSMEVYDYSAFFFSNVDNFCIWLLGWLTGNYVTGLSVYLVLLCPIIGSIAYIVLQRLDVSVFFATMGAVFFAALPYLFQRGLAHYWLSMYQFVPLSILLCIWLYEDARTLAINRSFFQYKRNYIALAMTFLIANNGTGYYAFFTCFFICVGMLSKFLKTRDFRAVLNGVTAILAILLFVAIALFPSLIYSMQNGSNPVGFQRSIVEAEAYGLKISQLFLPYASPVLTDTAFFQSLQEYYNKNALYVNENTTAYIGILGTIGVLCLLGMLFVRNKIKAGSRLELLAELNLSGILLAMIGGGGTFVALYLTQAIRGYNRISVFIGFFGILAATMILSEIFEKVNYKRIWGVGLVCISILALAIQIPIKGINHAGIQEGFYTDKAYVQEIENSVPSGAMIYQFPYHSYPEQGPVRGMGDYAQFLGYMHSENLKWSVGAVTGRYGDIWNRALAQRDLKDQIKILAVVGFEGIYVDRRAYSSEEIELLEDELKTTLMVEPIMHNKEWLSFFTMDSFNQSYRENWNDEELIQLKQQLLNAQTIMQINLP